MASRIIVYSWRVGLLHKELSWNKYAFHGQKSAGLVRCGDSSAKAQVGAASGFSCSTPRSPGPGGDFRSELSRCLEFFVDAEYVAQLCSTNQITKELRACWAEFAARARIG